MFTYFYLTGKSATIIPRELFSLDLSVAIERPDYNGNRLSIQSRYKAAKRYTEIPPEYNHVDKKLTAADKLIMDVMDSVEKIVGGRQYLYMQHILPHFSKAGKN